MTDDAAESVLIALVSLLDWKEDGRDVLSADWGCGEYTVRRNRQRYGCGFLREREFDGMAGDWDYWWYRGPDLAAAKRACEWHAVNGEWPPERREGWEFLKR